MKTTMHYSKITGELLGCSCSLNKSTNLKETKEEGFIEANVSIKDNYVDLNADPPEIKSKPTNPAIINKTTIIPNGIDFTTISEIPNNCVLTVDGTSYTVTDGIFEFSASSLGIYTITLELFPYLSKSFGVTAG